LHLNSLYVSQAANQHRMISEGSRDTEDWSTDAENSQYYYIFKYGFIGFFLSNNCGLGEHKRILE